MGDTLRSQTISAENQGIAEGAACDSSFIFGDRAGRGEPPILVGESSFARIRMLAESEPELAFTSLAHWIDFYLLKPV
jgi:hypothetical protein